jgi:hypothetical protein
MKYKVPEHYSINKEINNEIRKGVKLKRAGKYKEAKEVYDNILKVHGSSGELYIAMAKNLACNMEYEDAIRLFELANESCKKEYNQSNPNIEDHLFELKNRENVSKEEFLKYIKSIAGNPNYEFPKK